MPHTYDFRGIGTGARQLPPKELMMRFGFTSFAIVQLGTRDFLFKVDKGAYHALTPSWSELSLI